jgi:hypothetical protein
MMEVQVYFLALSGLIADALAVLRVPRSYGQVLRPSGAVPVVQCHVGRFPGPPLAWFFLRLHVPRGMPPPWC